MALKSLLEPIVEGGIKNINYFEGRLLSGKDLTEQETANRQHRQQLARAMGHGVVDGLTVSVENSGSGGVPPVVRIEGGTAITLDGHIVELPVDYVDIQLSRTLDNSDAGAAVFNDCSPLPSAKLMPANSGLYILVMSPAREFREYAPKSGLQQRGIAQNCGRAYSVEGVQFRLVKFDPTLMPNIADATRDLLAGEYLNASSPVAASDVESLSMMRNLVAYICFGLDFNKQSATDPLFLGKDAAPVGLDALIGVEEGLGSDDTALALMYWTLEGIAFLDNWAVKRKISYRDIPPYSIPSFTRYSYNRADESRLQFQEQLVFLQNSVSDLAEFNVTDYFRYLPPVGYLPVASTALDAGFGESAFFSQLPVRNSVFVESSALVPVTQVSMTYWPIDLQSNELIWLYRTRENKYESDQGEAVQEYIVFATGHAPYFGNARFNVGKWDYSNYGLII